MNEPMVSPETKTKSTIERRYLENPVKLCPKCQCHTPMSADYFFDEEEDYKLAIECLTCKHKWLEDYELI